MPAAAGKRRKKETSSKKEGNDCYAGRDGFDKSCSTQPHAHSLVLSRALSRSLSLSLQVRVRLASKALLHSPRVLGYGGGGAITSAASCCDCVPPAAGCITALSEPALIPGREDKD